MVDECSGGRLTGVTKRFTRRGPWIMRGVTSTSPPRVEP